MLVRDIMTTEVEWVSPDTPLQEIARLMRDRQVGCLPIGENDRLIGMVTDRDITCRAVATGKDPASTKTRDVMSKGIAWAFDDQDIDDAARIMEERQIHHLPVLNRQKRMVGIVSLGDLALRGRDQNLLQEVCRLASRDATRHASQPTAD